MVHHSGLLHVYTGLFNTEIIGNRRNLYADEIYFSIPALVFFTVFCISIYYKRETV